MNKGKIWKIGTSSALKRGAAVLVLAAAAALQWVAAPPSHAADAMMHSSASVESTKYGVWGEEFTCGTCHKSTLSGGNAKAIAPVVQGKPVSFTTYLSYGTDTAHSSSNQICEVCHTQTTHHRYDNSVNGANHYGSVNCTGCHLHSKGFRRGIEGSDGGDACDGCHSDLYINTYGWGMHSQVAGISYKHYLDNALTGSEPTVSGGTVGASWYPTALPDSTDVSVKARRCLMCHVDHDQFNSRRAFNLRSNAGTLPAAGGTNRDDNLCLSCHNVRRTKAYPGPNGEPTVLAIPFPKVTYGNATSVLNNSTHGYAITTTFKDGSTFSAICAKCHNDSIGKNGEKPKSLVDGQKGTFGFGEHNSTVPGRLAIFSNEFFQRDVAATSLTLDPVAKTVQVSPSPGWVPDSFQWHFFVLTGGGGSNKRSLITANTADTVTLQVWPAGIDNTSLFDIVDDNISVDNTCFNCHSRNGQGKESGAQLDWYGQKSMTSPLEGIFDLFVGDSGVQPVSVRRRATVTVYLKLNTWTTGNMTGYILGTPGGRRLITGVSAPVASGNTQYPYSYTLSLASELTSTPGGVEIIKPASHPLDGNSRHESDERTDAGPGWNKGDQGTTGSANSATAATSITDSAKTWSGSEFSGLPITFPTLFDATGKRVVATVTGGGAGAVTFTPAVEGLNTTGGDNYYIGSRHVSCADCHNTHASFKNPEGKVSSADSTHMTDSSHVNVQGWYDGIWNGHLLKVRTAAGAEQIRFITGFVKSTGTYTVSLPWNAIPTSSDHYEVLMGEKWTAVAGQSGGRAGSGSSGTWGVIPTAWRTPTGYGNMTGVVGLTKIENVFDNVGTNGMGGSPVAGQRDLCVRCHSSYSFGSAAPMTPSGGPGGALARSTDSLDEFNPKNAAHHAVYSRGRNQPIFASGDVAGHRSSYNPYWPAYGAVAAAPYSKSNLGAGNDTTKTVSVNTSGVATFTGGNIPRTVLPGWFIYINAAVGGTAPAGVQLAQGANRGWFEVVSVNSSTQVTLSPKPTVAYNGSYFKLTAGLGNTFVPPYGPWSILRCTDCHGSTKTDPIGPHASVNKWLIKSLDVDLSFDWYDGSATIATRKPNVGAVTAIFCFNCHRRDVYGDLNSYTDSSAIATNQIPYRSFSRQVHAGQSGAKHPDGLVLTGMYNDDGGRCVKVDNLVWGDISCRHCHAGDKVGGIHGTNAVATKPTAPNYGKGQGKRFLNGATWAGYNMPTTGKVSCYTQTSSTSVSTCTRGSDDVSTSSALYNYTSARY